MGFSSFFSVPLPCSSSGSSSPSCIENRNVKYIAPKSSDKTLPVVTSRRFSRRLILQFVGLSRICHACPVLAAPIMPEMKEPEVLRTFKLDSGVRIQGTKVSKLPHMKPPKKKERKKRDKKWHTCENKCSCKDTQILLKGKDQKHAGEIWLNSTMYAGVQMDTLFTALWISSVEKVNQLYFLWMRTRLIILVTDDRRLEGGPHWHENWWKEKSTGATFCRICE